jgi:hypothetical protein
LNESKIKKYQKSNDVLTERIADFEAKFKDAQE